MRGFRRIWSTSEGTVCLWDDEANAVREFWVPPAGGAVREIDAEHPGYLGQQVCFNLGRHGNTLWSTREVLESLIRSHYRRARRVALKEIA